jgi:hypothetical protein
MSEVEIKHTVESLRLSYRKELKKTRWLRRAAFMLTLLIAILILHVQLQK